MSLIDNAFNKTEISVLSEAKKQWFKIIEPKPSLDDFDSI
jgi:hypothetical protein